MKKQVKNQSRFGKYHATSKEMGIAWEHDNGLFIEYNPNIDMWRINSYSKRGVPEYLMGYSPHFKVLKHQVKRTKI